MTRSSLAPETTIKNDLRTLHCFDRNFCKIVGYAYGSFAKAMAGITNLDPEQAIRLRDKIEQMKSLVEAVGLIPDWSQTQCIAQLLTLRSLQKLFHAEGEHRFDEIEAQSVAAIL